MPRGTGIGAIDARYESKYRKNVIEYGATANGTTDDTAAVKSARDACSQNEILFFPYGRYYLSDTITIANNLCVLGVGPGTQIFMAADKDLFSFTGTGYAAVRDMRLGSAATTAGKCLVKLGSTVSHYLIENLWGIGSYYGIGLYGAMFGIISNFTQTGSFYRSGTSVNQAWIHGERAGGHSINGTVIIAPKIQIGVRGIDITDTNSEGTIEIIGGLIESVSNAAIYLSGIGQFAEIRGMHFESSQSNVHIVNCRNINIASCFLGGSQGVIVENSRRVRIGESYAWQVNVDSDCRQIEIDNVFYAAVADGGGLSIYGGPVTLKNMENSGNASEGGYGYYTGGRGVNILTNGDLETWAGGVPTGFGKSGTVTQETTTVKRGSSAARVTSTGALTYTLEAARFQHGIHPITISAWCYKPAAGGVNPRIQAVCNYGTTPSPGFSISANTWTRINVTFYINGNSLTSGYISFTGSGSGDIIYDDLNVSEEVY